MLPPPTVITAPHDLAALRETKARATSSVVTRPSVAAQKSASLSPRA
jgi:hypothetical protein